MSEKQPEALRLADDRPMSVDDDLYQWAIDAEDALRRLHAEVERLAAERDNALRQRERLSQILAGIHGLLYPEPIKNSDGQALWFRPNGVDPHSVLQDLSDRIRAIPDAIRARREE